MRDYQMQHYSPTAITLGSAAIVKVSGQNCFRTVYGSLGQTWAAKRFHRGSAKVPPRFHQGCASFVMSLAFWGRSVLGCQKVLWKVPPRFQQVFSHSKGLGVLCNKWLSPPNRFFGVFPKLFPAVFGVNGCCFRRGSVEGSPNNPLHLITFVSQMAVAS